MKFKRILLSAIAFLTIFCISIIFNFHIPFISSLHNYVEADVWNILDSTVPAVTPSVIPEEKEIHQFSSTTDSESYTFNDVLSSSSVSLNAVSEQVIQEIEATPTPSQATVPTPTPTPTPAPTPTPVPAKYADIGISVAKDYVNIRKSDSTDSESLGKLYRNSAAVILSTKGDWYQVESGSVTGYVSSDFIKTGLSDEELIENYSTLLAVVDVDGLNVRAEADQESKKVTVIYQNETYPVKKVLDDFVKITVADDNVTGYVKKEYVELVADFEDAVSKEEEEAILKLQAEARAKKETEIVHESAVNYSAEDLKLLACLVHSEAGTQSYEGKLAVANIVLNRVNSSKYANTIKGVIYQSGQFTVAASGSLEKQLSTYGNYCSNSQLLSIKAAKAALEGANNIGSRLYFCTYTSAVKKGYDDNENAVKLGAHLFW
ncbi:MAG: cell wall hydrolase [Mobilitalea sp.]